ncbi:MAG: hypothetical protein AB8G17_18390 [Gammaproteobacteria bacterium]
MPTHRLYTLWSARIACYKTPLMVAMATMWVSVFALGFLGDHFQSKNRYLISAFLISFIVWACLFFLYSVATYSQVEKTSANPLIRLFQPRRKHRLLTTNFIFFLTLFMITVAIRMFRVVILGFN